MTKRITIRVSSRPYEDDDDCLAAAERDVARELGMRTCDLALSPRWDGGDDGEREHILLDVPEPDLRMLPIGWEVSK